MQNAREVKILTTVSNGYGVGIGTYMCVIYWLRESPLGRKCEYV